VRDEIQLERIEEL